MLAVAVQSVFGVWREIRIELGYLPGQPPVDRLEKRLDRFHDMLPGTSPFGVRHVGNPCRNHF